MHARRSAGAASKSHFTSTAEKAAKSTRCDAGLPPVPTATDRLLDLAADAQCVCGGQSPTVLPRAIRRPRAPPSHRPQQTHKPLLAGDPPPTITTSVSGRRAAWEGGNARFRVVTGRRRIGSSGRIAHSEWGIRGPASDGAGVRGGAQVRPSCGSNSPHDGGAHSAPARKRSGVSGPREATEPGFGAEPRLDTMGA
jgi:hypothetical protein